MLLERVWQTSYYKIPSVDKYIFSFDFMCIYVEIKCQLDATEVFIADLIACSTCFGHHYTHHQELKSIILWLLPVVFRAVVFKLLVWCGAEVYVSGLQDAAAFCKPARSKSHQISCYVFIKIGKGATLFLLVRITI